MVIRAGFTHAPDKRRNRPFEVSLEMDGLPTTRELATRNGILPRF